MRLFLLQKVGVCTPDLEKQSRSARSHHARPRTVGGVYGVIQSNSPTQISINTNGRGGAPLGGEQKKHYYFTYLIPPHLPFEAQTGEPRAGQRPQQQYIYLPVIVGRRHPLSADHSLAGMNSSENIHSIYKSNRERPEGKMPAGGGVTNNIVHSIPHTQPCV